MTYYIYLLREREYIKTEENIYKIGISKEQKQEDYPKGSELIKIFCDDCVKIEKIIKYIFIKKFKHRIDIGKKYFEGNLTKMMNIIHYYVNLGESSSESDIEVESESDIEIKSESDIEIEIEIESDPKPGLKPMIKPDHKLIPKPVIKPELKSKRGYKYICESCNRDFDKKKRLDIHKEKYKGMCKIPIADRYKCDVCKENYFTYYRLKRHKNCETLPCGVNYNKNKEKENKKAKKILEFFCSNCNASFPRKFSMQRHEKGCMVLRKNNLVIKK